MSQRDTQATRKHSYRAPLQTQRNTENVDEEVIYPTRMPTSARRYMNPQTQQPRKRVVNVYDIPSTIPPRRKTTEEEQVSIPVPAIITKDLFEAAQKGVERNRIVASRNNLHPQETLLRAGLVKCGNCGGNLTVHRDKRKTGNVKTSTAEGITYYVDYTCGKHNSLLDACPGAFIPAHIVDKAAWERALEIIQDPSEVDKKLTALKSDDPTASRRKNVNKMLADIRKRQNVFREQLANLMMQGKLDRGTEEFLTAQLQQLADQEEKCQRELAQDEDSHEKWKQVQLKIDELHKRCADMREKISDQNYEPSYDEKRDFIEFFGIAATVWKRGHSPRFKIECNPPDIMSLISSAVCV